MGWKPLWRAPWAVQALLADERPSRARLVPSAAELVDVIRVVLECEDGHYDDKTPNAIARSLLYGLPRTLGREVEVLYSDDDIPKCGGCK